MKSALNREGEQTDKQIQQIQLNNKSNMISNNNNPNAKNVGMVRGGASSIKGASSSAAARISTKNIGKTVGLMQHNSTTTGQNVIVGGGNNASAVPSGVPVNDSGVTSLSEIRNYLQPMSSLMTLPPGSSPFDHIIEMMRGLDLQDDGITMNHKIKSIEIDFCNIVRDENMLW